MKTSAKPPRVKGEKDDPRKVGEQTREAAREQPAGAERTGAAPSSDREPREEQGTYASKEITNHDEQEKITNADDSDSIPE